MKSIVLHSAIAEITANDFLHPGLRLCKFVFCDDRPNENGQGVEHEDFAEIKNSAIGTPFKMKFLGQSAAGHLGSVPIGYIRDMYEEEEGDVHKLVAVATLFADEFPEEVNHIEEVMAEAAKNPELPRPGVSFEMTYKSSLIKEGVEWLKELVTKAATFVRNPAYGNRTAILALASNRDISEDALIAAIAQIHDESTKVITDEGGKHRMEEELQKAKDELEAATKALAEANAKVTTLEGEVQTLQTASAEKDATIKAFEQKEVTQTRVDELAAAGFKFPEDETKLAAKTKFISELSDEAFAEYKEDISTALAENKAEPKSALASLRQPVRVPRIAAASADESVSVDSLKGHFSKISRSSASTESE